jgi:hypothetical protein
MDAKDRLSWVADFDSTPRVQGRSRALTGFLSALFGTGAVAALALLVAAFSRHAEEETGIASPTMPSASPLPTVSASASAEPHPDIVPSDCDELFSDSMVASLTEQGFALDPGWDGEHEPGSADEQLQAIVDHSALDCHWSRTSPSEAALLTSVVALSPQQDVVVRERLAELGYQHLSEHGGVRYVVERREGSAVSGESHFLRDGLWLATHWVGHGPYGYTADMVRSVYG